MPVITFEAGPIAKEKKAELAHELTIVASKVTGIPEQRFIVFINEYSYDNIAVGGVLMSEEE